MAKVERNTLLAIFWALGCEEHAIEDDDEENARIAGESARKLVREYLGEMSDAEWCELKHYGLSYVNTAEQIGKKMRRGGRLGRTWRSTGTRCPQGLMI